VAERGELRADRVRVGSRPLGTLWKTARRGILPQLTPELQAGRGSCLNNQRLFFLKCTGFAYIRTDLASLNREMH
jgi:hypothetical protein